MFRKKLRIKYNDISNEGMLFEKLFDTAVQQNSTALLNEHKIICKQDAHVLHNFMQPGYILSNIQYHGFSLFFSCVRDCNFSSDSKEKFYENLDKLQNLQGNSPIFNNGIESDGLGYISMKRETEVEYSADDEEFTLFKILLNIAIKQTVNESLTEISSNKLSKYKKICFNDAHILIKLLRNGYKVSKIQYKKNFFKKIALSFSCDRNYPLHPLYE